LPTVSGSVHAQVGLRLVFRSKDIPVQQDVRELARLLRPEKE
jgi:hypothetical protein